MIIKKEEYEERILRAFQSGRESKIISNDEEAIKSYAETMGFKNNYLQEPIIIGASGRGMARRLIIPTKQQS